MKDVVTLHQLPRSKFTPSISPFSLKLETYLRMAGIRYQVGTHILSRFFADPDDVDFSRKRFVVYLERF